MKVKDAIRMKVVAVDGACTVKEAARLMDAEVVGALVVTDFGCPVGIVTDRDIVVRGIAHGHSADTRIDSLMSRDLRTIDGHAEVRDAIALFHTRPFRRVPVIEDGELIGMLSIDDLLLDVASEFHDLLRPIAGQVRFGYPAPRATAAG